jgi:predicted O-linked N-acetylglucosamine transferase (SPINDLY family)
LFRGLVSGYLAPMSRRFNPGTSRPPAVHPLLPEAAALHQAGHLAEAAARYERIVAEIPGHFDATHLLGVIALQEGRFEQAEKLIKAALTVNPRDAAALSNLGAVYLRSGQLEASVVQLEKAIRHPPVSAETLVNLGSVLRQLKRSREALVPLRRAYATPQRSATLCNLIGACLLDIDDAPEAVKFFEAATRIEPEAADGWANLSIALGFCGEPEKAGRCAENAIALQPTSSSALAARAAVQIQHGQIDEAIATYWDAVALPDASNQTRCAFALALLKNGNADDAIEQLHLALAADSDNMLARWLLAMAQCKPIFDSAAESAASRASFSDQLNQLSAWFAAAPRPDAYVAVGSLQPFYLAYQQEDNRELLMRYGRLCVQCMESLPGASIKSRKPRPGKGKLRIGIVAAHIRNHSVWVALTKGLVRNLDREKFELHLFQLDPASDAETEWAIRQVATFENRPKEVHGWAAAIRAADLDVLLFPEVGMDPVTAQLAALRLAPVQATTWGHPQTSGLPTMDLYFSAVGLEPAHSQGHYSERLVCLPNLGACVEPWSPTIPDLPPLGDAGDEPLVLCPGTPFKYAPAHDWVWPRIAKGLRRNGGGRLVFFLASANEMNQRLKLRLRRAFRAERMDFDKHVYLLPFLPRPQFFGLMRRSALMLDTLGFSGFNTALQGIEAGLPVLAREGEFLRGRLASGIMRQLDLPQLVAVSDDEFVDKAVQLTGDSPARAVLARQLEQRKPGLFNDPEPVRALERCLLEAVG